MTSRPRRQSAKTKRSPSFVFYAWSLFIVTGWVGIVGVMEYSAHLIASQGRVATATITRKVLHAAGEEGYPKTSYEEDFVFTTAAGKQIEGKTNLTPDSWERIRPGDTLKVTYAAGQPDTYRVGTDKSTTVFDCFFVGALVIWLVFLRLTLRARHRRATPRTRTVAPPDSAAAAARPAAAKASVNGWVLLGAAFSILGAIFLLIGVTNLVSARGDRAHGRAATAIVLTKSTVMSNHGGSYPLDVRFTTAEGKSIETSIGVDYATMTSLHEHLPVDIIYAPEHPEKIRLASDDLSGTFVALWFVSGLGGIFAVAGAVVISFSYLDAKHEHVLHQER